MGLVTSLTPRRLLAGINGTLDGRLDPNYADAPSLLVQGASTGGPLKWAGILSAAYMLKGCAVDLDRISIRGLARACHSSSRHPPPAALAQWAGLDLARLILCRSRVGMQSRGVSTFSRVFVVSFAGAGRLEDSDYDDSAPLAGNTLTQTGVQ